MFEHELNKIIPATVLLNLKNVTVNSDGMLFHGSKVLSVSFPSPSFTDAWNSPQARLKFLVKNSLFRNYKKINQDVFWFTDTWSREYFHWMTDALPRLFTVREKIENAVLLLPGTYQKIDYVLPSLKPFLIKDVKFIRETFRCENLKVPTHTAPTGNYNEAVIKGLSSFLTNFYQNADGDGTNDKIYISRSKTEKRKIVNEDECLAILEEYGFKTVYFEHHTLEQQINIASNARYLISNHGAGLTNMLFMKTGGSVFELRQKGDAHSNCYFALASALNLKYFYQICEPEIPGEDAHTANLIVDCHSLRKNIEQMLDSVL